MSGPITDPGVTVATGDPEAIAGASNWHTALANKLEAHSALIKSTASVLLNGWSGPASAQYQEYSAHTGGSYEVTAAEARSVASALKRFSSELGSAQGQGKVALQNAIHWMNQVNSWRNQLASAQEDKATAEANVKTAMQAVIAANNAASLPHAPATAAAAVTQAKSALATARNKLATAETAEQTATKNLTNAAHHFTTWQMKGGQALQQAEQAAGVAGIVLADVEICSPTVANAVDRVVNAMTASGSSSASWFDGVSLAGGGGSALANWSGQLQVGAGASASATGTAGPTGISANASAEAWFGEQGTATANVGWSQLGATGTVNELVGGEVQGTAQGQIGLNGLTGDVGGSAFVGGEANATGSAYVGPMTASGNAGVSYGAGVTADGSLDLSASKISFSFKAGVTLGLGANVGGSISFDPQTALKDVTHDAHDARHDWDVVSHDALSFVGL